MTPEEHQFTASVRAYIAANPHMVGATITAVQSGVDDKLTQARGFAVDMETIAAMALNARVFKSQGPHIAQLLRKHKANASLKWDEVLGYLEKV